MIDTSIKNIPYPWPLDSISLRISSEAPLSGDYTDRGIIEWRGDAYATIYPEGFSEEEEEFSVLSASGLLIDQYQTMNIYDALDSRSSDYEVFGSLFTGNQYYYTPPTENSDSRRLCDKLITKLAAPYNPVVLLDQVSLLPSWRGHGLGRVLTARLLRLVCLQPSVIALAPGVMEDGLSEEQRKLELAKIRRTWRSIAFKPFDANIMIVDPGMVYHENAVAKLSRKLGLD